MRWKYEPLVSSLLMTHENFQFPLLMQKTSSFEKGCHKLWVKRQEGRNSFALHNCWMPCHGARCINKNDDVCTHWTTWKSGQADTRQLVTRRRRRRRRRIEEEELPSFGPVYCSRWFRFFHSLLDLDLCLYMGRDGTGGSLRVKNSDCLWSNQRRAVSNS